MQLPSLETIMSSLQTDCFSSTQMQSHIKDKTESDDEFKDARDSFVMEEEVK